MNEQNWILAGPGGRPLYGITQLPAGKGAGPVEPCPTVLICHGFKGFMEWGFFPHLAQLLADRGFVAIRFNMSGTGMKPGDELVTDTEAFRANTLAREQEDLQAVLAALGTEVAPGWVDRSRLGLLGHSRGGAAVLGAAARDTEGEGAAGGGIRALVTWNSIGKIDRFNDAAMESWRREGELPVKNARTGQELALGPELLAEVEARPPELDLLAAAGRRQAPWLILHGEEDESVPVAEGQALAVAASPPTELAIIAGGSHTFGSRHPFTGPTPQLIEALNLTQTWFRRYLTAS